MRHDLRFAVRTLSKSPGFTALAVAVLALGIGATTAMFSAVNSLLLEPLPIRDAERMVLIWERNLAQRASREGPSGSNYWDWRDRSRLFEELAAIEIGTATVTGNGEPEQVPGMRVSTNFLTMLGARPVLGRIFTPQDGLGGRQAVGVMTKGFWQRRFGSDPSVIGRTVMIDLIPYTIVGVLDDLWQPVPCDVMAPWPDAELRQKHRLAHDLGVIGKLKPGVTPEQAEAELNGIAADIAREFPAVQGWGVTVVPMKSALTEAIQPALWTLFAAVALLLVIAAANVANLLLARAAGRGREVAIRAALGAGRWKLGRQFLIESLVLSAMSGVVGVLLALWGVEALRVVLPGNIPVPDAAVEVTLARLAVDWRVLAFAVAVSVVTGLLFGLAPALQASKAGVGEALKSGARALISGTSGVRRALLVAEVALALVLLVGASLVLESFAQLGRVDVGFRSDHLLTLAVELPTDTRYRQPPEQAEFFRRTVERIRELPGVRNVGATSVLPLAARDAHARFIIEGAPPLPPGTLLNAEDRRVTPDYFRTMGIPLRRGRVFDERDAAGKPLVVVVDETLAAQYFGSQDPIGKRIVFRNVIKFEIVGVVGAARHLGLALAPQPTLYASWLQAPAPLMNLVVRAEGEPGALAGPVKQAIWSVDGDVPVYSVRTMDDVLASAGATPRVTGVLLALFAGTAVMLAALGIYGVMAYTVAQRRREIGIRMALGARPLEILRHMVGDGVRVALAGVVLGVIVAAGLTRFLGGLLYGVSATDPLIFAGMATLVIAVAAMAAWLPARRAARIEPLVALREE